MRAEPGRARAAAAVFSASVVVMFGASAIYHRGAGSVAALRWLRRVDHAGIYGLIAGSYTPVGLLVLHGGWRVGVLAAVWGGCLLGIALKVVWVDAPTWLSALVGVLLGWVGILVFPQLIDSIGLGPSLLLLGGGVSYTIGAVIYARRRPNPVPGVFGFHELFHAFVIVAVALHYTAIAFFVLPHG